MKKIFSSLMLHFFSYLKNYLTFIGLLICAVVITYFFKDNPNSALYCISIFIWASIILSFLLGVNEYRKLCYNYLNVKINRKIFYVSSVVFTIINALFLVAIAALTSFLVTYITNITVLNALHYVYLPFVFILAFAIGNCLALIFDNLRGVGIITIIVFAFLTLAFNEFVMDFIFNYLWIALNYTIDNLYVVIATIISSMILFAFIYYQILTLDVQRIKK